MVVLLIFIQADGSIYSPITYACQGGLRLGKEQNLLDRLMVTKSEYEEYGSQVCHMTFITS